MLTPICPQTAVKVKLTFKHKRNKKGFFLTLICETMVVFDFTLGKCVVGIIKELPLHFHSDDWQKIFIL